jgi:glycosyltransferase involved in cell wall biosynthesis
VPILERSGWHCAFWVPRPSVLFDELQGRGYEVDGAPRTVSYSLRALRLPPGPRERIASQPRYLARLRRWTREQAPDLAHVNSLTTLADAAALRALGLPVVAHIHEMIAPTRKGRLARAAIRAVATEAIAVSTACADRLAIGSWRPRLVHEAAPIPAEAPRRERGAGDPLVFGSVGVISRRKGSDLFVEAAAKVRAVRPAVEFELVGSPSDPLDASWAEGVLRRAAEVGVRHIPRADVPALLARWDAFALPSRRDPFPISMLEAMGSALPVVGARTDGIPEQLGEGEAGLLVPSDDSDALAAAMLRLADEGQLRTELGERARERVLANFTLERQADGVERAWAAALAL